MRLTGGYQDDQSGMQRLRRAWTPEIAGIVGDQNEIAFPGIAGDIPVLPAGPADTGNMMDFVTGLPGGVNQVDGEAFVDRESHGVAIAASRRRERCAGCRSRQGCLRGRPRSGYAAA